jgi:dTDP-4-amino-4,6-dideoxygalactose transaminase
MRVEFSPPDITELECQAVLDVLKSGWLTTGPITKALERELVAWTKTANGSHERFTPFAAKPSDSKTRARSTDITNCEQSPDPLCTKSCADVQPAPRAVAFNSATAALECALRLLEVGSGDEVITAAYTFSASASVIYHVGATPVLVDCAPGRYEMDYAALAAAITPRTKVIIPVDIGGVMCDYHQIWGAINDKSNLFRPTPGTLQEAFDSVIMVTDAAHSLGADRFGHPSGSVADFSAFSFHAVKNVTSGEGGALVWKPHPQLDDDLIYRRLNQMALHGQTKDALAKSQGGAWEYDIVEPGYKYNLTDIAAALALAQLQRYPHMLSRRRHLVRAYRDELDSEQVEFLDHLGQGNGSSCHLLMLRLRNQSRAFRDLFIKLMAARGIATNVHYQPLPLLSAYRQRGFDIRDYPQALAQFQNEISLPLYSKLTDEQLHFVCAGFAEVWKQCRAAGV